MELNISLVKATGSPDALGWSQVHDFKPQEGDKFVKRGRIIAVYTAEISKDEDQSSLGKELITRLHEEYYGNLEKSAYTALKEAVSTVYSEFNDSSLKVEISAVAMVGEVLYAASAGGSGVAIYRRNMLARIIASGVQGEVDASGYPEEGDILIIGSGKFFAKFAESEIIEILKAKDIIKAQEEFAARVMNEEDSGRMAVAILEFSKREEIGVGQQTEETIQKNNESAVEKKNTIKKLIGKLHFNLPVKKLYIKSHFTDLETAKSKKTTLSVGIILLAILLVSIFFGIKQKKAKDAKNAYQDSLQNATHKYEEAVNLSNVNQPRARELINESRDMVDSLIERGVKDQQLDSLKENIDKIQEEFLKEYNVNPELFLNITLLTNDFEPIEMTANKTRIVLLDKSKEKVTNVGFDSKDSKIISGPNDIKNIDHIALYSEKTYAMGSDGVYDLSSNQKVIDKDFSDNSIFAAFAGNIYVLDRSQNQIIRYPGNEGVFGGGSGWLGEGVNVDLSDANNMVIDGSIWISFEDGNMVRMTQGNLDIFDPQGIVPEIDRVDYIYTESDLANIYILERAKGRVVVLDKEGEFVGQYLSDQLKNTFAIVASEQGKKIVFPIGGELFTFGLK